MDLPYIYYPNFPCKNGLHPAVASQEKGNVSCRLPCGEAVFYQWHCLKLPRLSFSRSSYCFKIFNIKHTSYYMYPWYFPYLCYIVVKIKYDFCGPGYSDIIVGIFLVLKILRKPRHKYSFHIWNSISFVILLYVFKVKIQDCLFLFNLNCKIGYDSKYVQKIPENKTCLPNSS